MYSVLRVDFTVVPGHPYCRDSRIAAFFRRSIDASSWRRLALCPINVNDSAILCDFALRPRLCHGVWLLLAVDAFANQTS
jgi:hypothetical protein